MLQSTEAQINGRTYSIGQLPADVAFEMACIVADWRGKQVAALGDAALTPDLPVGAVPAAGRMISAAAKMLRDPEYREKVWKVALGVCSCDGVPVLRGDWATTFAGDRLGDLYELHLASVQHSCGGFLRALGLGAAPAPQL